MAKAYAADLAYVHHAGFTAIAEHAAPAVVRTLHSHGIRSGLVLDLGCGSGVFAAGLLRAGYDVRGIDYSPAMLAIARRIAPRARFTRGSLHTARLPRCAAVTALGECFNYLFDAHPPSLADTFARIRAVLDPGGLLIFDAATPGRAAGPRIRYRSGPEWAVIAVLTENPRTRPPTLTRDITTFRKVGRGWRRSHEIHRLRLYTRAEVTRALRSAGFSVRTARSYGGRDPVGVGLTVYTARALEWHRPSAR